MIRLCFSFDPMDKKKLFHGGKQLPFPMLNPTLITTYKRSTLTCHIKECRFVYLNKDLHEGCLAKSIFP